jgi:EmrB/QacA subfamily drug resistance transporter
VVMRSRLRPEYAVAAMFVSALFMNALDVTVVNVTIPTLVRDFHSTNTSIEWVITGYLLALGVAIPASGWLGDHFGTKRTFLLAVGVFTFGSVACAAAGSMGQLVGFRVVQGAGGGLMLPVGFAMLFRAFPPERRARVAQLLVFPIVLAPTLGPIIGGFFAEEVSWRWIFLVNLPVGIAVLVVGSLTLHEQRQPHPGRFDVPGFVLSGGSLALLLFAISQGPGRGWGSTPVVFALIVGIGAFALMVRVELTRKEPMLSLRLLKDRLFRSCNEVAGIAYAAFLGFLFVMPLLLQEVRGLSPLESGLTTFPEALGVVFASQLAGRFYPRIGPRRLMMGGLLAMSVFLLMLSALESDTDLWVVRVAMFLMGCTMACVVMPQNAATFTTISDEDMGRASAIFNMQRQVCGALGVAVLATVLTSVGGHHPDLGAFRAAFVAAAVLALFGVAAANTVSDRDAAPTMRQRNTLVEAEAVV